MTSESTPTARQIIKERLQQNKCSASDCDNPAYNEELFDSENETDPELLLECEAHKEINELLIKQLNIGVKFENTRQGRFARTPRFLAAQRRYAETDRGKQIRQESREKYNESEKGKRATARYEHSDRRKLSKARYRNSPKGIAAKEREKEQRKVDRLVSKAISRLKRGLCSACGATLNNCKEPIHIQQNEIYGKFLENK